MTLTESDFASAGWFTSSFSGQNGGECVEVAFRPGLVGVRDSKQHGEGPVLVVAAAGWAAFLAGIRDGRFDLPA